MNRAAIEFNAQLRRMGFRDLPSYVASKRKADRRRDDRPFDQPERRLADRRSIDDNAAVAAWLKRFDELRETGQ